MAKVGTSNVNVQEIGSILNVAGGSVNINQPLTFFTAAAKINKWARNKPEDYNKVTALSDRERKLNNFGLRVSIGASAPNDLLARAASGEDFCPHTLPTGGEAHPYRLSDFLGYNTAAPAPYIIDAETNVTTQAYPTYGHFEVMENSGAEFTFREMGLIEGMHLAILYTDGDNYYLFNPAEESDDGVRTNITFNRAGTYGAMAVYTNYAGGFGIVDVTTMAETFVPVPDSYRSIKVTTIVVYAKATVSWGGSLYYNQYDKSIGGFNMPRVALTYPNGSTPSFIYELGFYIRVDSDFGDYYGEWYYSEEAISGGGNSSAETLVLASFPTHISLSDIIGAHFDPNTTVYYISLRPMVRRISGQGWLEIANTEEQVIYENWG